MAYSHILTATDFSVTGNQAVRCAFEEATLHHAKVTLLHVLHHQPDTHVYFLGGHPETRAGFRRAFSPLPFGFDPETGSVLPILPSPEQNMIRDYDEEALEKLQNLVPQTFTGAWKAAVASGEPARAIVQVAQQHAADLIVIGAHGHRGLRHTMHTVLGGVAEKIVRHAPCAVLSIAPAVERT